MNRICLQKKILLEKMWQKKQAYRMSVVSRVLNNSGYVDKEKNEKKFN